MRDTAGRIAMTVWCDGRHLDDAHHRCDGFFCTCPCHVMNDPRRLHGLYQRWVATYGFVGVL